MADPLSGLVTGGKYEAESVRVRVVEPSMPDIEAVREAMASVLDEDSELRIPPRPRPAEPVAAPAAPPPAAVMGANDPDAGDGGTDVGPEAPSHAPTPPAGIPAARLPMSPQRVRPPRPIRRGSWSPGLAAVGLLLLVIAVLVIVMLANLIDTISSLFS
jgi:hypothetical protein